MTTTTRTVVLRERVSRVEERPIEVTFPVYRKEWDSNYSGTVPYDVTDTLTRIEGDGRVTEATRTTEECGDDGITKWVIETEVVEDSELGGYLSAGSPSTAEEFEAHIAEARAWMGI